MKQRKTFSSPFVISAILMLLVGAIACLNAFSNIFAPWGHGFAIGMYMILPIVWICIVLFSLICYNMIKPQRIPRWSIILPAIVPIIDILSKLLVMFAAVFQKDEIIDAITNVSTARILCIIQLILCIPFVISVIFSNSVRK